MTVREMVTLHLPIEMGCASRVMLAVAREYPDAVLTSIGQTVHIVADDDPRLTKADRRHVVKAREADRRENAL